MNNDNKANFQDLCESLYIEFKSLNSNTQKSVASLVSSSSNNFINIIHSIFPKLKDIVSTLKDLIELEGSVDGDRNPIQKLNHNSKPPPPPSTIMSIMQLRAIYTSIELIWCIAIEDYVSLKSEINETISFPSSMLLDFNHFKQIIESNKSTIDPSVSIKHSIFCYIKTINSICEIKGFTNMMRERNLKRVLLSLIVLKIVNDDETNDVANEASDMLDHIILNGKNKLLTINSLRLIMTGNDSVRKEAGYYLTNLLMSKGGLYSVLLSFLENIDENEDANTLYGKVIHLVTSTPSFVDKDQFFDNLIDQIYELYIQGIARNEKHILKSCGMLVSKICVKSLIYGAKLMRHLMGPIELLSNSSHTNNNSKAFDESELHDHVRLIHHLLTSSPVSPSLINCISQTNGGRYFLMLYTFIHINSLVYDTNTLIEDICISYLRNLSFKVVIREIVSIIFMISIPPVEDKYKDDSYYDDWPPTKTFTLLESGGISLVEPQKIRVENRDNKPLLFDSISTKDSDSMELYNIFNEIQQRSNSMIDLLVKYEKKYPVEGGNDKNCVVNHSILAELFFLILKEYLNSSAETSTTTIFSYQTKFKKQELSAVCGLVVVSILDKASLDIILQDGTKILMLLKSFIESHELGLRNALDLTNTFKKSESESLSLSLSLSLSEEIKEDQYVNPIESTDDSCPLISTVLAILSSILGFGSFSRSSDEEKVLKSIMNPLQQIAILETNPEISQSASDIVLALITRSADIPPEKVPKSKSTDVESDHDNPPSVTCFEKTLNEVNEYLKSETPAMRGLGVRNIIIALREPPEKLTASDIHKAAELLIDLLADPESFVYLNVIHALGRLADIERNSTIAKLLSIFANTFIEVPTKLKVKEVTSNSQKKDNQPGKKFSKHHRSLIAEVLIVILRKSGEIASQFVDMYVFASIKVIKEESSVTASINSNTNLMNDNLDNQENQLTNILRQSAISLLAESIVFSGWSSNKYLPDVLDISAGILLLENPAISRKSVESYLSSYHLKYNSQTSRRAAAFMIHFLITGLKTKLFEMNIEGAYLKNIESILEKIDNYRFRSVNMDGNLITIYEDKIVLFHVNAALIELQELKELLLSGNYNETSHSTKEKFLKSLKFL